MKTLLLAAAVASLCAPAIAVADDENWTITGALDALGVKFTQDCRLANVAGKLSGPCNFEDGVVNADGHVAGSAFQLAYDAPTRGGVVHIVYRGTVAADGSVSGSVDLRGLKGRFRASRK
jgi:hypothetical protein